MITVTEAARDLFREIDHPDGTVLRLGPVTTDRATDEVQVRLGVSEPKDDQVVQHEEEDLLRKAPSVRSSAGAP